MDIRQLSPTYFVGPQIEPSMLQTLKEKGVTRVLCNRPDVEVPAPLGAAAMQAAAEALGLEFQVQPLTHQTMTEEVITHNREIGADQDGVTFAYCASGTRSCIAWALGQAGKMPAEEIITAGRNAGYDLEPMRAHLENAEA